MERYGYINEGGYLKTKQLEEYTEQYREGNETKSRTVSIEEQAAKLAEAGWKPVDALDNSKLQAADGYIVRVTPYDAGERISFNYEQVPDTQGTRRKIEALKRELAGSDYKVIKCFEASLAGEDMPYDIESLCEGRQKIRDEINGLRGQE